MAVNVYDIRIDFEDNAQLTDKHWSNVWHVLADDDVSAAGQAANIANLSPLLIPSDCKVLGWYSHAKAVLGSGQKGVSNLSGTRTATDIRIPAWNVAQMRIPVTTIRPILKYLRMGLTEADIDGQTLEVATIAAAQDFGDAVVLIPGLCTVNGLIVTGDSPAVSNRVCMRQLGWRRRARVGYKRGWVPV